MTAMISSLFASFAVPSDTHSLADGDVRKVYIVFSNHLDVGYTLNLNGSCAAAALNQYWEQHVPKAIATAEAMRANGTDRYRWMCHSYIYAMARHCSTSPVSITGNGTSLLRCPNASTLAGFNAAARRGDVTWHAMPFNVEPEIMDASTFEAALQLTANEDAIVGHAPRLTYNQRDVPGLSRASIPLLVKHGVRAVSVGENGASAIVNVPPAFVWRDNATQTEVLALFHARGYGRRRRLHDRPPSGEAHDDDGDDDDDDAAKHASPRQLGIDRDQDCITVASVGICLSWRGDNAGPHAEDEARSIFAAVRSFFPNATVVASDAFDDFVADVLPVLHTLPVVTAELGDTWIYGADADPLKVAKYRRCHARGPNPRT